MIEKTVQIAKRLLKKAYEDQKDPYLAILELRNTPLPGIGLSPTFNGKVSQDSYSKQDLAAESSGL